ncbi:WxL protein host-binding domain-containing protein [Sphingobacterium rhinopitheci]|uniref:WxL protein host-binding domain-containing protein n=1 Tax=Sphingobacterium rhinopitheci TaxID=2781960 RepID=UPI001F51AAFD|nr:DUF3324 domain-containing protein [Sphingobacterium rhinopitheci]MCI0921991.1 DUF3324 domain-containing protein [Sphingobacterium rhinopitheci]
MIKNIILLLLIIGNFYNTKANIIIVNGLTHQFKTEKGQIYTGKIEVQNIGKTTKSIKLYLQDMSYNSEGEIYYTAPGSNKLTNTDWLKFNTNHIELQPGQKSEFSFEFTVPNHITDKGTYWSTCMIEPVEEIPPNNSTNGLQINSVVRYAIQLITDYSTQSLSPVIKFKTINVDNSNPQKYLKIALANDGKIFCRANISIDIFDKKDGIKMEGNFMSQTLGLLPNTSKTFPIDISGLKSGTYKLVAFAKDELDNIFAIEFELDV